MLLGITDKKQGTFVTTELAAEKMLFSRIADKEIPVAPAVSQRGQAGNGTANEGSASGAGGLYRLFALVLAARATSGGRRRVRRASSGFRPVAKSRAPGQRRRPRVRRVSSGFRLVTKSRALVLIAEGRDGRGERVSRPRARAYGTRLSS